MSLFPIGLFIALAAFTAAVHHLNQNMGNYYDFVAFFMVIGGTLAVAVIVTPWDHRRDLLEAFRLLFKSNTTSKREVLEDCINSFKAKNHMVPDHRKNNLYSEVIHDGLELLDLGLSADNIEMILHERIHSFAQRKRKVANSIRSLAKYPPAFGLIGTVLGLVNVMRGVSAGADGKQTAVEMAIALVATMYGLAIANLIVNPAGELALKQIVEEESHAQLASATILMLTENASLLVAQEFLNSFVSKEDRVNVLQNINLDEAV